MTSSPGEGGGGLGGPYSKASSVVDGRDPLDRHADGARDGGGGGRLEGARTVLAWLALSSVIVTSTSRRNQPRRPRSCETPPRAIDLVRVCSF